MRRLLWLPLLVGLFAAELPAGSILFQVTNLGASAYRYTYTLNGLSFQPNQELDLRFDASLYNTLSNGIAGSGFDLLLIQPNIPPGNPGDYSAMALVSNPSLTGPFSVDFIYTGQGTPGSQPYFINQLDSVGNLVSNLSSGTTTSGTPSNGVPEPASFSLAAIALILGGAAGVIRRRRAGTV